MSVPPVHPHEPIVRIFSQPIHITNYICNWSKKFHYIYVETAKVACTTIKKVLQSAEVGDEFHQNEQLDVHDRENSPLIQPISDVDSFVDAINSDEYFRFSFVRNPFSRALSCYLDKFVYNEYERIRLSPMLGIDSSEPPAFYDFLRAVEKQEDQARDIHWASQTFLLRPNCIRYSFIGRFEFFQQQFGQVCQRLDFEKYNTITRNKHSTNARSRVLDFIGKKEIELIHKIYEFDFTNFGYGWSPDVI